VWGIEVPRFEMSLKACVHSAQSTLSILSSPWATAEKMDVVISSTEGFVHSQGAGIQRNPASSVLMIL
jgi:hypothetical protein